METTSENQASPADEGPLDEGAGRLSRYRMLARRLTGGRSHLLLVAASLVIYACTYALAHLLRFEFEIPNQDLWFMLNSLFFAVVVKLVTFYSLGTYRILWVYVGLSDLFKLAQATIFSSLGLVIVNYILHRDHMLPRSVVMLDGVLTFLAMGGLYATLRWLTELEGRSNLPGESHEPVLIVGAGAAGESLLREFERNPRAGVRVVGFLDDDPVKARRSLRGVHVLGGTDKAREISHDLGVRKAYIAIPSAGGSTIKKIARNLLDAGLAVRVLPPMSSLSSSASLLPQLREISIEDLLRRKPIKLDTTAISAFIKGKVVMVTGGAGSIGSELCRQILDYQPARLVVLDRAETPLHDLLLEIQARMISVDVRPELVDITDASGVEAAFARHKPEVVFHAAALKHVPLLQAHAREAVRVNVTGTRQIIEAAQRSGTGAFVLISTDKAVNPANIMGTTKRLGELMVRHYAAQGGPTRFAAVRFGNVLGSQGSVLPIFKTQLARGGPLTVTHPDMRRYFMTIPEAVQLILQAAVLGQGGSVFLLDMGEPVRIIDMAADVIRLSGLIPDVDIKIQITGMRPGEKMDEELHLSSEECAPSAHPQIFSLRHSDAAIFQKERVEALEKACASGAACEAIADELKALVQPVPGPSHP